MADKNLEKLRSLAQLDVDAIGTYDAAMNGVREDSVRSKLAEFRVDHARHVQDLNAVIQRLGGEPVALTPDIKGTVLKTMTQVTSYLGTEAALLAMVGNEELTNRAYDAALTMDWGDDAEVRELLERNRSDERRHLAWIKHALRERPWAHREADAHP